MITLTQIHMSVDEFISLDDCPIQRNTELHAKKAIKKHLKRSSETHKRVAIAKIKSTGKRFKIDGHSRAFLWDTEELIKPLENLLVDLYIVDTLEEVIDLYKQFDSPLATESAVDRLNGSYRYYNFFPASDLVKKGCVMSCATLITSNKQFRNDVYNNIRIFIEPLKIIDNEGFKNKYFSCGVYSAMILTVMSDGASSMEFWRKYYNDSGLKEDSRKDAVQAMKDMIVKYKKNGKISSHFSWELLSKCLSCYINYRNKRWYSSNIIKETNVEKYISNIDVDFELRKKGELPILNNSNFRKHGEKINSAMKMIREGSISPDTKDIMRIFDFDHSTAQDILFSLSSSGVLRTLPRNGGYELNVIDSPDLTSPQYVVY